MTRVTQMAVVCAHMAVEDSGINFEEFDKKGVAVILGVVTTGNWNRTLDNPAQNIVIREMTNAPCAWISLQFKLEGPCFPVATACASSAYAMGIGYDLISNDKADVVIVGGTDSHITPELITGFNQLYTLSVNNDEPENASKPFSQDRDGFVMGEGAGIMILEFEIYAKIRSAKVYASMDGYSITSEAHNIVSLKPDGSGMVRTMNEAISNCNINIEDIDYIYAHGTSTFLNDRTETMAIKNVFGNHSNKLCVSSSKSMIGHTIGAAGAVEGIITAMSIKYQIAPPTINYRNPDPELDLDYVPNTAVDKKFEFALSNSFGFGGHNASIFFGKYN